MWLALTLLGCPGEQITEFPAGLEPLEENTAPFADDGEAAETLSAVVATDDLYTWGHARFYVHAPAADVWNALKDPLLIADRRGTDVQEWEENVEPEYEYGFRLDYTVNQMITVEWSELWRYGTVEGEPAAPELAMIRYQKTEGSGFLELIEGSILVRAVDDELTEVELVQHMKTAGNDEQTVEQNLNDQHDNILAGAHGEPLPTFP